MFRAQNTRPRFAGVSLFFFGLFLLSIFGASLPTELELATQGETRAASILSTEQEGNYWVQRRKAGEVRYTFEFQGQTYTGSVITLRPFSPGSAATVEFLASDPSISRLSGTTRGFFGYMGLYTGAFSLFGIAFFWVALRRTARVRHAFQQGQAITARITHNAPDPAPTVQGARPWLLRWEFSHQGQRYTGGLSSPALATYPGLLGAEQLVVFFDPARPESSAPYLP
jgi:hypothetical protein